MRADNRKLLVVDDDPWVGKLVSFVARDLGFDAIPARDGAEALDRFADELPDGVVVDVVLPKIDGLEVCRRLKSSGPGLFTPVLVVSGVYRQEREAVKRFQADGFCAKPLSPEVLQRRLTGLFPPPVPLDSPMDPPEPGETPLASEPVAYALARLRLSHSTGTLTVRVKGATARLFLREGILVGARSEAWSEGLGTLLARQQRITVEQGAQLDRRAGTPADEARAGELAIKEGFTAPEELLRLRQAQLAQRVQEVLRSREGFASFAEGPGPSGTVSLEGAADSLLHWGLRSCPVGPRELRQFVPRPDRPLVRDAGADAMLRGLALSRGEKWLLDRADQSLSLEELLEELKAADPAPSETVQRAVVTLTALGVLVAQPRAPEPIGRPAEAPEPTAAGELPETASARLLDLWRQQATGTLEVEAPPGTALFHVREGRLVAVHASKGERLEIVLAQHGIVRPEHATQARLLAGHRRNIADVLVEMHAVSLPVLLQFVRGEILLALQRWLRAPRAPATFVPGALSEGELAPQEWDIALALLEAARGLDLSWVKAALPSLESAIAQDSRFEDLAPRLPLNADERKLLGALGVEQPLHRLWSAETDPANLARSLAVLLTVGLVRSGTAAGQAPTTAAAATPPEPAAPAAAEAGAASAPRTPISTGLGAAFPFADEAPAKSAPAPRRRLNIPTPSEPPKRADPRRLTGRLADGGVVPRALYDEALSQKRELEKRLFALIDARDSGEVVDRALFEEVRRERNELRAQLASLLQEVLRLKGSSASEAALASADAAGSSGESSEP